MDKFGLDLNPHIERNVAYEEMLIKCFNESFGSLVATAIADTTQRRNLTLFFWPYGFTNGSVNYCVKEKRFDFIQYSVKSKRGAFYAKRFAL